MIPCLVDGGRVGKGVISSIWPTPAIRRIARKYERTGG